MFMFIITTGLLITVSSHLSSEPEATKGLNTVQIIEYYGYKCENHQITTEDGYILTYQKITGKNSEPVSTNKPSIILMHGITMSSVDYVNMGPSRSLGFILSDLGYDVWLANARGTPYSRNHTTLDIKRDAAKFFDFSWHEIGYYDLAAAINYILRLGTRGLYYVGHSQGGVSFLVLMSTRPEFNSKVKLALFLAPSVYQEHKQVSLFYIACLAAYEVRAILPLLKIYEVPLTGLVHQILSPFCDLKVSYPLCLATLHMLGSNGPQDKLDVIFSNFPTYSSMKQFTHFGQLMKLGGFTQYDYGDKKNKRLYGSSRPPNYNLSKVVVPIAEYYSVLDYIVHYLDVKTMIRHLPNVVDDYMIPGNFGHLNFLFDENVKSLLYDRLIQLLLKYSST